MEKIDVKSPTTINKMVSEGLLPKPTRDFAAGPLYWWEHEVDECLRSREGKTEAA